MNDLNPAQQCYEALQLFTHAHRAAERADSEYQNLKHQRDVLFTAEYQRAEDAKDPKTDKPLYSNKEKREFAAQCAIEEQYPELIAQLNDAEQKRNETGKERDRLHESLKTYRGLLAYAEAQLRYETAQMEAKGSLFR